MNISTNYKLLVLPALFFLSSCSLFRPVAYPIAYETTLREAKPNDHAIEILDAENIEKEYKVIGEISILGDPFSSSQEMKEKLFEEARKMGGDAIIDFESDFVSSSSHSKLNDGHKKTTTIIWKAKIIVWVSE